MISLQEIEKAYNAYSGEIFSYIFRSVNDHTESEDILQEVFIKLINYSKKETVNGKNIRALLYSIARSVCIDTARKSSKKKFEPCDITDLPDMHTAEKDSTAEMIDAVNLAIDSLPEPEKSIILFRQSGLKYDEITKIIKIPERTLKRRASKALIQIRGILKKQGFSFENGTEQGEDSFKS